MLPLNGEERGLEHYESFEKLMGFLYLAENEHDALLLY